MKKNVDLLTGKQIPEKMSSIEKRLAVLGLNDNALIKQVEYLKKELEIALEKNYRLEKEIIFLKKEKNIMLNDLNIGDQFG